MKINPQGNGPHFPASRNVESSAGTEGSGAGRSAISGQAGESIADLVTRLSIAPLVEILNQPDEQRADLVARAREKLASGEYLTPLAAQQTADSILSLLADDRSPSARPQG